MHLARIGIIDAQHLNETVRLPVDCGGRISRYSRNEAAPVSTARCGHAEAAH
jgi:hypothetical protein